MNVGHCIASRSEPIIFGRVTNINMVCRISTKCCNPTYKYVSSNMTRCMGFASAHVCYVYTLILAVFMFFYLHIICKACPLYNYTKHVYICLGLLEVYMPFHFMSLPLFLNALFLMSFNFMLCTIPAQA